MVQVQENLILTSRIQLKGDTYGYLQNFGFNWSLLIAQIVNFVVVFFFEKTFVQTYSHYLRE